MTPFDRPHMTLYSHSVVTLVIVCTISETYCDMAAYLQFSPSYFLLCAHCVEPFRVKTYLHSTVTQTRPSLITLHVHTDRTDVLDLKEITDEFTARNELCRYVFGKF